MKSERLRIVLFCVILFIVTLLTRFFFLEINTKSIAIAGDYYQNAVIDNEGIYQLHYLGIGEVYTKLLSLSLLIWGNSEMAGVYLNIILQILAIIILYFAVGFVANCYVSFLIAAVVSFIPFYLDKVYEFSTFNLFILIYAIVFYILALISKGVYTLMMKKRPVEHEKNDVSETLEKQTGVITLDDIIGEKELVSKDEIPEEKAAQKEEKVPLGMKEIILDEEEKKKKVKFIENPLPVPKRHEHKEMDFSVELQEDNDDYDINDVSGMDFFDIE